MWKRLFFFVIKINILENNKKKGTAIKKRKYSYQKRVIAIKNRSMYSGSFYIKIYKNKLYINNINGISNSKINNKILNLLKSTKVKKNFSIGFLISKLA